MPQYYSQRMLNPYHGLVQVVEIDGADAVSRDGLTWTLYLQGEQEACRRALLVAQLYATYPKQVQPAARSRRRGWRHGCGWPRVRDAQCRRSPSPPSS
jgi:hypothetical protein